MSYCEKRESERIACQLNATIVTDDKFHDGFIKNISKSGLEYVMPSSINPPEERNLQESIELIFAIYSNELIHLDCAPIWFAADQPTDSILIGMKVINPPPRYNELIRTIQQKGM